MQPAITSVVEFRLATAGASTLRSSKMKSISLLSIFLIIACTSEKRLSTNDAVAQDNTLIIIQNLEFFDASSHGVQHPLICGEKSNYPNGRELTFSSGGSVEMIHAVFPENINSPKILDGEFELEGRFMPLQQARDGELTKRVNEDYQYFLVQSWNQN